MQIKSYIKNDVRTIQGYFAYASDNVRIVPVSPLGHM